MAAATPKATPKNAPPGAKVVYKTLRANVKPGKNQHVGFTKGKGYYVAPGAPHAVEPVDPMTGMTQAQLNALVSRTVGQEISPEEAQLKAAEAAANKQYGQETTANSNLTTAYRQLLAQIPGQVSSAYGSAANADAAYGKGFSDVIQQGLGNANASDQSLLDVAGAPTGQQAAVSGALTAPTDAMYGMGGVAPAEALQQEGAAAVSAAKMLPASATASGLENLRAIQGAKGTTDQTYAQNLSKLLASIPSLRTSAIDDIEKNARAEAAQQLLEQKYGLQTRTEIGNLTGVDPATGQPTARAKAAAATAAGKTEKAHATAVKTRNTAVSSTMTKMLTYVQKARHATGEVVVAREPVLKTQSIGGVSQSLYLKKDGTWGVYVGVPGKSAVPKDAVTRAVYSRGQLPAPQYKVLHDYVYKNLQVNLTRFGYTPADIEKMTEEIVGVPPTPEQLAAQAQAHAVQVASDHPQPWVGLKH